MAKHDALTQAQIDEICAVYDECRNQLETAKRTKHSISTVSKYLIANGRGCGPGGNQETQRKITDEELLEAVKTMTTMEIVKKWSIHETNVLRRCKKLGIKPLGSGDQLSGLRVNWGKHNENLRHGGAYFGECWHYMFSFADKCNKMHPNFQYLETRRTESGNRRVRLKCKRCGTVIERAEATVRQKGIKCDCCEPRNEEQKLLQDARVKMTRFFIALKESKTPKRCENCGDVFYSQYANARYCSPKCKRQSKQSNIRTRCKKYGVYYDASIKPKKIFQRDGYICQICGLLCDTKDTSWNGSFGPFSPTIDHRIALANGGTHTWDNVQCAHAICNSYKRDLITA